MPPPAVKPSLKWEFERSDAFLMQRMGDGPFLMGGKMTLPDIIACHCADWAFVSKFPISKAFKAYAKRLRDREAYSIARAR